ncbi:hypothetical protein V6N13_144629 [Hibiscus sabdariffa]
MDSPSLSPESGLSSSTAASNDAIPRVKFLCSFLGGILPRPQDGKLRYVGGETHIVSVPRDISYAKLMTKMRELYDGAAVLKYQQPGEDLDALVSVTNDDDVINMMEEFEKLGSRDRFTRLRIFLFLHPDQDGLSQYVYGNERETERRFVDDLKILNVGFDFRKYDSPVPSQVSGDSHLAEQFLDLPQRHNEMEGPWSTVFYSPSHHGHHTPRTPFEFPPSPSPHYRVYFPEFQDKCMDRVQEEYVWQRLNCHPQSEHQPHFWDNVARMPIGMTGDKACSFPSNILHGHSVHEGNHICIMHA